MGKNNYSTFDQNLYKQKVLGVFSAFNDYCRSKNLRYFAVSGTLLGAVRHKGFIPWDDDVDVVMPRPDYDRFIQMTLNNFVTGYMVMSVYNEPNYMYPFAKVIDANTTLIETVNHKRCVIGAFIDIFPIDGLPKEKKLQFIQNFKYTVHFRNFLALAFPNNSRNLKIWNMCCRIIGMKLQKELLKMDMISKKYTFETAKDVKVFSGSYGDREIVDKSIFNESIELPFENLSINSVAKYEYYLTRFFGDYMQLPPKEQQCSHHSHWFIDLSCRRCKEELRVLLR